MKQRMEKTIMSNSVYLNPGMATVIAGICGLLFAAGSVLAGV
jgi:hypothetical protein